MTCWDWLSLAIAHEYIGVAGDVPKTHTQEAAL